MKYSTIMYNIGILTETEQRAVENFKLNFTKHLALVLTSLV